MLPLSISPEPEKVIVPLFENVSALVDTPEVVTSLDWYSILAVPPTESSPACANVVAASVPAKAVKPIFFKFVIYSPIVIFVITNSVFYQINFFLCKLMLFSLF